MDDPTDTALAASAIVGLLLCGIGGCWAAWRNQRAFLRRTGGMKASPSMENLTDIASENSDPANNV